MTPIHRVVRASGLYVVLVVALAFATSGRCRAEQILNLDDVDWTIGKVRSEMSTMRERPTCVGLTDGEDEEFDQGPFSIVPVTFRAKKAGTLVLVPELFLVRDGGLYGVYRVCQGIRIVRPKPDPRVASFHPPANARRWPGHAGRIACKMGDAVVVDLLFHQIVCEDVRVLAALPISPSLGDH